MLDTETKDKTFLLKLSHTLPAEIGVEAVGTRAVQMMAKKLGADRIYLVTLTPGDVNILVTKRPPRRHALRGFLLAKAATTY